MYRHEDYVGAITLVNEGKVHLRPLKMCIRDSFTAVPLAKYLLNTLIFTVITTAIMMVVITLAAYAFARLSFPGKNLVFTLFLSLMMKMCIRDSC